MFSGIGGFELGIKKAHPDWECIGYSEIDKYAIQVYDSHFKHRNYGDATRIDADELPNFDILVGGFPCQAFSVAGKRRGFEEARGTLFFEIARILKYKRPRYFLLENVKGLLSHDTGKTFQRIFKVLTDLGYCLQWQVLNSKDFGVPQNRERIYIVGHLGGGSGGKVFPLSKGNESLNELSGQQAFTNTLLSRYTATGSGSYIVERKFNVQERKVKQIGQIYDNPHNSQAGRVYDRDGISPTIDVMQGGNRQPKVVIEGDSSIGEVMRIRRLTPVECERLQAFPDGWTAGISDSQRYKCLGNAVTVNVIKAIMCKF